MTAAHVALLLAAAAVVAAQTPSLRRITAITGDVVGARQQQQQLLVDDDEWLAPTLSLAQSASHHGVGGAVWVDAVVQGTAYTIIDTLANNTVVKSVVVTLADGSGWVEVDTAAVGVRDPRGDVVKWAVRSVPASGAFGTYTATTLGATATNAYVLDLRGCLCGSWGLMRDGGVWRGRQCAQTSCYPLMPARA